MQKRYKKTSSSNFPFEAARRCYIGDVAMCLPDFNPSISVYQAFNDARHHFLP
jgi:hypothetical protein